MFSGFNKYLWILGLIFSFSLLEGKEVVVLNGHLDKEVLAPVYRAITYARHDKRDLPVIELHSSSGDLDEVLRLAQAIADAKKETNKKLELYIRGKAIGPAAILPFLADHVLVTPLVAWGDIPYGQSVTQDWSILCETIKQWAISTPGNKETKQQLVDAMVDPKYQMVINQKRLCEHELSDYKLNPLILNCDQLQSLGLIATSDVMTHEEFAKVYLTDKEQATTARYSEIATKRYEADFDQSIKEYLSYSQTEKNLIGYLFIGRDRPIDQTTYLYVKFALEDYRKKQVRCILLHLNTPGGEVLSSLKIVDLLQAYDINNKIPVIALIDDWAISAGAMLAYSCRFIGVVPTSIMGAAEPVLADQQGGIRSASEKVNSVLRTEFASLAKFYGRNPLIAKAMVDKDLILVVRDQQVIELRKESDLRLSSSNPDIVITDKGKLLTLDSNQLMELGIADFSVPLKAIPPLTAEEKEKGVWPATKSLAFEQPSLAAIPNAEIISYQNWRLSFFSFLSHPLIAGILLVGLILGFYIEINTPGFGVAGAIGVGCLALILLSSFASEAINWIEVLILAAGIVLLLLELFVIPGFGVAGILGIALTVIGLFALMLPGLDKFSLFDPDTFALIGIGFFKRLAWLCGFLLLAIGIIVFLARVFSHRFFRFSKLVLVGEQEKKEGYSASIPREKMPGIGELGETVTPLRPSGKVHIGDNLFDAITQGNYLDAYIAVEVIRIEGSKVVVREIGEKQK